MILLSTQTLLAQDFKLGNVSVAEVGEKEYATDPSAAAAILFKDGSTLFEVSNQGKWWIITEVKVKVKIYKKEGYKYADVEVPYYVDANGKEEVYFYDAVTYNLVGGKVEKTKLTDEGKFVEDVNKKWRSKKLVLPNVKEGSVIEYRYKIKSPYITSFPDWYFQYAIPVKNIRYEIAIPSSFSYNRMLSPYLQINEKQEERTRKNHLAGSTVTFGEVVRIYTANNIPALNDESFVDNINNYRSYVKHELASSISNDGFEKKYATDWDAVVKSINGDDDFGGQLKLENYFKEDLSPLLAGKTDKIEIVNIVFDFVKNRMAWNEMPGYNCKNGVKKAYEERVGNAAEINLMLVAMLRYAGINANPVLLSTRDNGHAAFVNRDAFNYVIAGIDVPDNLVFLDATNKNTKMGILPVRALNLTGRMVMKDLTSVEVNLLPNNISRENTTITAVIGREGNVTGKVKKQLTEYNAFIFREQYGNLADEANIERNQKGGFEIKEYSIINKSDVSLPLIENFSYTSNSLCDIIGDKIYISPLLFYTKSQNPFRQEQRSYPLDFMFPQEERFIININIPEGYVVESLPQAYNVNIEGNIAVFKFNISEDNQRQIQVSVINSLNVARLEPEHYQSIRDFYAAIIAKQAEKIILTKKV